MPRRLLAAAFIGAIVAAATFVLIDRPMTDDPAARSAVATTATPGGAVEEGRSVFARIGCGNCHAFAAGNTTGGGAPDLDVALDAYDRETLKARILDPYPDNPPGSFTVMPEDFGERLTAQEIDALVAFLLREQR